MIKTLMDHTTKSPPRTRIRNFCYTTMHVTSDKQCCVSRLFLSHERNMGGNRTYLIFFFMDQPIKIGIARTFTTKKKWDKKTYPVLFSIDKKVLYLPQERNIND